jgi:oligoribonuclease NrnB/cAMP/cGMP phosphodiesterase (DHH superfamily)
MKTLCIYHANCADGFGAAWVVRQALGAENVDFHAGHYGKPAPDVFGLDVIIVDFSYPLEELEILSSLARSILIIDHHKTAAEALAQLPPATATFAEWTTSTQRVGTVFDMERSGAGLTWDYFNPGSPRPALINHIEDRDLWRFKLEGTREVMASVFSYPHDFDVWDAIMEISTHQHWVAGKGIDRKHHKDLAELIGSNARLFNIAGYSVPTINLPPTMASDAGHLLSEGQPFAAIYWDTDEHRKYSLRSRPEGLDVSEIAKQFGGGGHRGAAGFKVPFDHELVTGHVQATLESTNGQDIVLNTEAQSILAQCISAHGYVVAALTNGRPDLALAEARLWVESFTEAARQLTAAPLPMPVTRDELGHWTHPAWPQDGDENAIPKAWFANNGLEPFIVEFENDAPEALSTAYFEQGNPDCSAWQPSTPPGEGWFVFSIHDTEDGPVCIWVRPVQEQQP